MNVSRGAMAGCNMTKLSSRIAKLEKLTIQAEIDLARRAVHTLDQETIMALAGPGLDMLDDGEILAILDGGEIPERALPTALGYEPPQWAQDELIAAMGKLQSRGG